MDGFIEIQTAGPCHGGGSASRSVIEIVTVFFSVIFLVFHCTTNMILALRFLFASLLVLLSYCIRVLFY